MSNKKYIKVEHNPYGYEIYAVNGQTEKRFRPQEKIIMHKLLRNYRCIRQGNNTFIFTNYNWLMLKFRKEKLLSKPKKVNRNKSKQIISGILVAATIMGGIHVIDNIIKEDESSPIINEQTITPENPSSNIEQTTANPTNVSKPSYDYDQQINVNDFYYEFSKPNDKEALINAQSYMALFYKYEKMYGVDAKLLCAIGAQESSGIHRDHSTNGGYATGIMGIEYVWANENLRVFNFEKNEYETIKVDYSRIGELEYNIRIGAAIFQNYFYHTLKNSDSIAETDYLPFTLQKYNMGPGNMRKILGYGGNWIDNRDMINAGDKYYFEHVLSRFDNDTIIQLRLIDGSYYNTKLTNLSLEKHHSRS